MKMSCIKKTPSNRTKICSGGSNPSRTTLRRLLNASSLSATTKEVHKMGYWKVAENQRRLFDEIGSKLGIRSYEDWYKITSKDISYNGGRTLMSFHYNYSILDALRSVYPEFEWVPWKFDCGVPKGFWSDETNQRLYFDWLGQKLNFRSLEDWYKAKSTDFEQNHGTSFLHSYLGGSFSKALLKLYPKHSWQPWRFEKVSRLYWDNEENQKKFLEHLSSPSQLNIQHLDQWYNIKATDVMSRGGLGLLIKYKYSLIKLLMHNYPEHNWQPFKFHKLPKKFWDSRENVIQYLKYISEQYNISSMEDWNTVTHASLHLSLLRKYGGLHNLLQAFYPGYSWKSSPQNPSTSKSQHQLYQSLKKLFGNIPMLSNYRHPEMKSSLLDPASPENRELEFDIFIPQFNMALEYHGQQHYHSHFLYGDPNKTRIRDNRKKELCNKAGITLIEVGYWWDRTTQSLAATIYQARPDIYDQIRQDLSHIVKNAVPIAETPPPAMRSAKVNLTDPQPFTDSDLSTEWVATTLSAQQAQGCRCYWDGSSLFLRSGYKIPVPSSLVLPNLELDLILSFPDKPIIKSKLLKDKMKQAWNDINILILDSPSASLKELHLSQRLATIQQQLKSENARVADTIPFNKELLHSSNLGILRNPVADYGHMKIIQNNTSQVFPKEPSSTSSSSFPFQIQFGQPVGGIPACKQCRKPLARTQPRLVARGVFTSQTGPIGAKFSFCLDNGLECFKKCAEEHHAKNGFVRFPAFDKIEATKEVVQRMQEEGSNVVDKLQKEGVLVEMSN